MENTWSRDGKIFVWNTQNARISTQMKNALDDFQSSNYVYKIYSFGWLLLCDTCIGLSDIMLPTLYVYYMYVYHRRDDVTHQTPGQNVLQFADDNSKCIFVNLIKMFAVD